MRTRPSQPGSLALGAAVALGLAAAAGLAIAQQPRRKLHADLPVVDQKPSPVIGGGGSGNPAAFQSADKLLTEPALDEARRQGEPVFGKGGFAADRQTSMALDGNTGSDGTLHYASVFNPDIIPFKRLSAYDGIDGTFTAVFGRPTRVEVPVIGTTATDKTRDRFWGSIMIHLQPGGEAPLPSVAPDMRILSYEAKIQLQFTKDGADNFYVRARDPGASGTHRLVFFVDADAGYFAPSLPTGSARLTPAMVLSQAPASIRPSLPRNVQREAEVTLRKLRVNSSQDLSDAFNALVGYFRAFKPKTLPPSSGNLYRDLCDSQAGVCRHRSLAFMITANALGIPTRLVVNEAHAFVEVWFPERQWQRIDLGGAALRMEVTGANDKQLHRPRAEDPFVKPDAYRNNYTQLEGEISGLTQQQLDDKRRSLDDAPPSGQFDSQPADSNGGSGPDRITPDPGLPVVPHDPKKAVPELEVLQAAPAAYRGAAVTIAGRVVVNGKGIPDHPVDVYLSPKGRGGAEAKLLGRAITGADGTFKQDFTIPAQLQLKTYEIWLGSPEDAYYNAALSD